MRFTPSLRSSLAALIVALAGLLLMLEPAQAQDSTFNFGFPDLPGLTFETAEAEDITIVFSCSTSGTGCGTPVTFTVTVPTAVASSLTVVTLPTDVTASPPVINGPNHELTLTYNGVFLAGGDILTAEFRVRATSDAYTGPGTTIPVTIQADNGVVTSGGTGDFPVVAPTYDWDLTKTRILPPEAGGPEPAVDANGDNVEVVRYRVRFCPQGGNTGNWDLQNLVITDTFPAGAVNVSTQSGTGVIGAGTITWTLGNRSFTAGCFTDIVTMVYPSPPFVGDNDPGNPGDEVTNHVAYTAEYNPAGGSPVASCDTTGGTGVGVPVGGGNQSTCTPATHGFQNPVATPAIGKGLVQNPVGITGTGRFTLDLNTTNANVAVRDVVLIDEVQPGPGGLPWGEITEVILGEWTTQTYFPDDGTGNPTDVLATVDVSATATCFTNPAGATWTVLATDYDGNGGGTFNNTTNPGLFPDNNTLRCVRATFRYIDNTVSVPGVPLGFSLDENFVVAFEPRTSLVTSGDIVPGGTIANFNCLNLSYTDPSSGLTQTAQDCEDVDIAADTNNISADTSKTVQGEGGAGDTNIGPLETATFRLNFNITERSSDSSTLSELTVVEAISQNRFDLSQLQFTIEDPTNVLAAGSDEASEFTLNGAPTANGATLRTITRTIAGEPRTLYIWNWPASAIADGTPPTGATPRRVTVVVTVPLRPYVVGGTPYTNRSYFLVGDGSTLTCEQGGGGNASVPDTDDVDGDGSTTEQICEELRNYNVPQVVVLRGQKWIRNETNIQTPVDPDGPGGPIVCEQGNTNSLASGLLAENDYSRFPCFTEGVPGDTFTYRLTVQNLGNDPLNDYAIYDILPYDGDVGNSRVEFNNGSDRESEWRPRITPNGVQFVESRRNPTAPPTPALALVGGGDFTIEYNTSVNPCRSEIWDGTLNTVQPVGCDNGWTATPPDWSQVRSFRIRVTNGDLFYPGDELEFLVTMQIPTDETIVADIPFTGEIAWGNFGHTGEAVSNTTFLPGVDVPKVGIRVPETVSVGNRVWYDNNNNREFDPGQGETPVPGVTLRLYEWTGTAVGAEVANTTTDANGYYIFNLEPPGVDLVTGVPSYVAGQNYVIVVDGANFTTGQPLFEWQSSFGTEGADYTTNDTRDRGEDAFIVGGAADGGVRSAPFTLSNAMGTGEVDPDPVGAGTQGKGGAFGPQGRGNLGQDDNNANLRVDFGFAQPMSLGNRVWLDNGAGGGTASNGVQDGAEAGIANVVVRLYADTNSNGTFERGAGDTEIATDTTDADGYYLFGNVQPGTYFVWVDNANFNGTGPLVGLDTSPPNGADDGTDRDDNGLTENLPGTNGVVSALITLAPATEPTGETDLSNDAGDGAAGERRGVSGERDNYSDLTIDFGFNGEPLSLGNRVWFDPNNNGLIDPGENGIAGVRVQLFRDADNNGTPDGAAIATDTTDTNGYYLFDGLTAGRYLVGISELDFRTSNVLVDLYSSTGNAGDTGTDSDDNGIDNPNPQVGVGGSSAGILSATIELTTNTEPLGEADLSGNPADGPNSRGNNGELDSNSNLTVDFGLYKPMSLGNRVWFDPNNNAQIDAGESGIAGVEVELFLDANTNGVIDGGESRGTQTTDANGYYLFSNLVPGQYIVRVNPGNFTGTGPLVGINSSTGSSADDTDSNDNGIDTGTPDTDGVLSAPVVLALDSEPINEPDIGPQGVGSNGETDNNSNLTVDFGFVAAIGSIGNRVWLDPNNNALIDAGENGIANVTVSLYRDTDGDGTPDGPAIATDTTNANGYYLFDGLIPGNYLVGVNAANFNTGNPLFGLVSSTGAGGDDQTDNDDNGLDTLNPTFGLLSATINLTPGTEPATEGDIGPEGNGGNGETAPDSDLTVDFGLYASLSLGNRLWYDVNDNGVRDATEVGVPGAEVVLYRDADNDGTPDGAAIATDTTDADGYYLFSGLSASGYIVEVTAANFGPAGPLNGLLSSTGSTADDLDNRDHGVDNATPATNGVRSATVTLALTTEPVGETDLGPEGRGANGETDNNSNLTVDFGFVGTLMSLGNRVWIDDGAGGGTPNDGVRNGGEAGVAGVLVQLFRDNNSDGTPDGAPIATDTTDANGYYLFDGLPPGNYIVGLNAVSFQAGGPLVGFGSTTDGTVDTDNNDNGVNGSGPALNGVLSRTVVLTLNSEPTGEADLGPEGLGGNGETDNNSNLTVDFGFIKPLSLGNRVWFDPNDDGLINPGEVGIGGVAVTLFRDANGNNLPDTGEDIATDTTDSRGYYLFDGLGAGTYIVRVDPGNFAAGNPLAGFTSSTGSSADNADRNDNGIDTATAATDGVVSNVVTLTTDGTPVGETDTSGNINDGPNFRGNNGESDNNSDLTIDFGFVAGVMSLGNRLWLDDNNNGLIDPGEGFVAGARVDLYADADNNGQPDGAALATDTTDPNGYYLFAGLAPGRYLVQVAPQNFQAGGVLEGLASSTGNAADTTDSNDNGVDTANAVGAGVFSNTVTLVADNAPTGETDLGPEGNGPGGVADNNADLTVDFGFVAQFDYGDNPNSFGTLVGDNGPRHRIIPTLRIGRVVDDETDGQPTGGADGDNSAGPAANDEDGTTLPTLIAGATALVEVTAFNETGRNATLIGWIDFNGNGTFEPSEGASATVPTGGERVVQLRFNVPISADPDTGGNTYARFRLTTDPIDVNNPTGAATDGEVEDYTVAVNPPGLSIDKTDNRNAVVAGQSNTYIITIGNSGTPRTNLNVRDTVPTGNPNGYDPATITWTCTATGGASCITGQTAGTGATGTGSINAFVDIPRDGQLVYELTATLRAGANAATITNTAEIVGGPSASDESGIIFDPPNGRKIGTVLGGNRIRWTMVWFNTGGAQTATITDPLQNPQVFDGNLVCTAFGTSTTTACTFAGGTVSWSGLIDTGEPNRVEIAFDVIVPGDGRYNNAATLATGGPGVAGVGASTVTTVTDTVTIGDVPADDGDDDDDDDGGGDTPPPENIATCDLINVNIRSNPPLVSSASDPVTWTVTLTNDSLPFAVGPVRVEMPLPPGLVNPTPTTTGGAVRIESGVLIFTTAGIGPNETVTITLTATLDPDVMGTLNALQLPVFIDGQVCNFYELLMVFELPETGETPPWRTPLLAALALALLVGAARGGAWLAQRR